MGEALWRLGMRRAAPAACCSSGLLLQRARFQGLVPPAALCLPGCAARLLLARHGWRFSLDSHGEGTEQLQTQTNPAAGCRERAVLPARLLV